MILALVESARLEVSSWTFIRHEGNTIIIISAIDQGERRVKGWGNGGLRNCARDSMVEIQKMEGD